jgi:PAS domain S-box-containing protein
MNKHRHKLFKQYVTKLRSFLADEQEATLQQAYELGRNAIANGLGVLDMAKIHQAALLDSLLPTLNLENKAHVFEAAETFLMEALSPFEATHRGFREANLRLQQLIATLEDRNDKLAAINRELEMEFNARLQMEEMWKRYESIVNTSKDFMTLISAEFKYEAANDAYCRAQGKKREDIVGHPVPEVWGRRTFGDPIRENLKACFAGSDVNYQAWFEFPTIGRHYFDVSCYPYQRDGRVTHAIVVTRDITERKLAEEKITKSEMMLAEAQKLAHLGNWEWDIRKNIITWSDELYRIYGLMPGEIETTYEAFLKRVHPMDKKRVSEAMALAWRQGQSFSFHHRVVRPDGSERVLHAQGRVVTDEQGQPLRMFGTGQDVTDFKQAEEALIMSEARLQAILDNSPAVIFLKDVQGRYLHINRQFERLFQMPREQVFGRTDRELFAPEQAAAFRANDRKTLRAGVPLTFEESARYQDGIHTSIVSKFPLRDAKGKVYAICGIATDITERKRAEEALRESEGHHRRLFNEARVMQENLRHLSNRILHIQEEERKRISRELHDEVGQALTAINVNLAVLKKAEATDRSHLKRKIADTQNLLEHTMEAVHRFARELRPAMLDDLGLLPALRTYINGFAERTGLKVRFRSDNEAEQLDGERKTVVYRITQESLNNVAKHAHASEAAVVIRKSQNKIVLEIKDNGRSFQMNAQTSAKGNKRLGLLGMQERVRLVNGDFAVQAEPGKGTVVRVEIPLKPK